MDAQYSLKHLKDSLIFHIKDTSILIGRSANCDIQVNRETLSREHARIIVRRETVSVQDLHSTNGTYVNARQIQDTTILSPGDVVRFGQESFCLQNKTSDSTVMFDRSTCSHADSAMLVEDDEEKDATVMLQSIELPVGWQNDGDLNQNPISKQDTELLKALKKHAKIKRRHRFALLVTLAQENKAPTVKLLSSDEEDAHWVLGRTKTADIPLNDSRVSKHHAQISLLKGAWQFLDTDSKNGSFQGNRNVKRLPLTETEHIDIGPFHLEFETLDFKI